MGFNGHRVLALESRRAAETAELIRRNGGVPFVAPSMKEMPLETNAAAFAFAEDLFAGRFDTVILLTGVGTRFLNSLLSSRYPPERFAESLREVIVVARGPKPVAALREMGLFPNITAPEPNTFREVLTATEGRIGARIAVQEYGKSNPELLDALRARGAEVTAVPVYQWQMPDDRGPLEEAVKLVARREFPVLMFTTSQQVVHLLQQASEMGLEHEVRAGIGQAFVASIGPTTTEALADEGFTAAMEPSHPKLGLLVKEAGEQFSVRYANA